MRKPVIVTLLMSIGLVLATWATAAWAVTQQQCEAERNKCENRCRSLPPNAKVERQRCWSQCNEDYANCIRKIKR
jgi:hypothetical protein